MTEDTTSPSREPHRSYVDKRIDDLKWYIGIFSGTITVLFAGLGIIVGLNLASEKSSLREYKQELKEEIRDSLGKGVLRAMLVLRTLDRRPLEGQRWRLAFRAIRVANSRFPLSTYWLTKGKPEVDHCI